MNVQEFLDGLTDKELMEGLNEAIDDLKKVSIEQNNSEWHESCFAGAIIFSTEAARRNLVKLAIDK